MVGAPAGAPLFSRAEKAFRTRRKPCPHLLIRLIHRRISRNLPEGGGDMRSVAITAGGAGTCLLIASGAADGPTSARVLATAPTVLSSAPAPPAPSHPEAISPEDLTAVVRQYCVVCHNDAQLTGNLTLQSFDVAAAETQAP